MLPAIPTVVLVEEAFARPEVEVDQPNTPRIVMKASHGSSRFSRRSPERRPRKADAESY
jgi:hypothetical protein